MSSDWDSWEAAEDAGAFDNVKLTNTQSNLRHEIDQRQFSRNDDSADIRSSVVSSEFETQDLACHAIERQRSLSFPDVQLYLVERTLTILPQQTAAFQVRILKRAQQSEGARSTGTQQPNEAGSSSRTLREREADYAKARERIFGSNDTSSREETPSPAITPRIASPVNSASRPPKGPDGTGGFLPRPR